MLVSALMGRERMKAAYAHAIENGFSEKRLAAPSVRPPGGWWRGAYETVVADIIACWVIGSRPVGVTGFFTAL